MSKPFLRFAIMLITFFPINAYATDVNNLPPVESLIAIDKNLVSGIPQIEKMSKPDEREATISALETAYRLAKLRVEVWKTPFLYQAQTLALDPKFTSIQQIPPDMLLALTDNPLMMEWLEMRAKANAETAKTPPR